MITNSDTALLELLGKAIDHPAVTEAVSELSPVPANELEVKYGLIDVRAPDHGLDITFKPASKLRDGLRLAASADQLLLAVIFFHAEGFEGYRGYSGTLPRGLCFDHSRAAVRAALGAPAGTGTGHNNDRWDTENFYMTLDFADDERSIRLVTVGLHWKPRATG